MSGKDVSAAKLQEFSEKKIRFHMVDDHNRQRSSNWMVRETNGNLYIAPAGIAGHLKLSLHRRGQSDDQMDSQFGTTRAYFLGQTHRGGAGALPHYRWQRPRPRDRQIVHVAAIVFPTDYLRSSVPRSESIRRRFSFPQPKSGFANEISFFYSRISPSDSEIIFEKRGFMPMFWYDLGDGEFASIVARVIPFSLTEEVFFAGRSNAANWLDGAPDIGEQIDDARAVVLWQKPMDHQPIWLIEIGGFNVRRN